MPGLGLSSIGYWMYPAGVWWYIAIRETGDTGRFRISASRKALRRWQLPIRPFCSAARSRLRGEYTGPEFADGFSIAGFPKEIETARLTSHRSCGVERAITEGSHFTCDPSRYS